MNRDQLKAQLIADEGKRNHPYKDTVGKWTIGVGRNLDDVGLSDSEIFMLLDNDIDKVIAQLNMRLPWWTTMSDNRQMVFASLCFQLGIGGLLQFKNMLADCLQGEFLSASQELKNSLLAKQCPDRTLRLAKILEIG